jgi:putative tryptophan/tyrosine transport system substrate-binding protein
VKRRAFITLLGGAAAWPLAARAQQRERVPRVGVLFNLPADDQEAQARLTAFVQGLQELGWTDRRNIRIVTRWATDDDRLRSSAGDLVALSPDVIVANSNQVVWAVQRASRDVRIVFTASTDPVAAGIVESLARPGGNTTGFISAEYGMSGKWLELLKEIAPGVTRVAVLLEPSNIGSMPQFAAIQTVAPSFRVETSRIGLSDAEQIERSVAAFAGSPNGGLIVSRTSEAIAHRALIITLAVRHRLPAVYPFRLFINDGGLICYGPDIVDQFRLAAGYVDRILRGEKPGDLPVQMPTKYELVINLKTAKALGLEVPPQLLARADEVIE